MRPTEITPSAKVPLLTPSPSDSGTPGAEPPEVLSYYAMRRAAGWIGILLPIVIAFLTWAVGSSHHLPDSISASYYTIGRNYFVGSLCAVGIFLICAVGYNEDRFLSFFAGALAFVVAFSPCTPPEASCITIHFHSNVLHGIAAALLFLDFAWMCLFRFTHSGSHLTEEKKTRNSVFRTCGIVMIVAMSVQVVASVIYLINGWHVDHLTYGVETVCLVSFGFAWIVKGQQLFPDRRSA